MPANCLCTPPYAAPGLPENTALGWHCLLPRCQLRTAVSCCEPAPTESCAATDTAAAAPQWWPWPAGVLGSWSALPFLLNSLHNRTGAAVARCAYRQSKGKTECVLLPVHSFMSYTECMTCAHRLQCCGHSAGCFCSRNSLLTLIVIFGVARCPSPQPGVQVGVAQVLHGRGVPLLHVDLTHACVLLVSVQHDSSRRVSSACTRG